MGIMDKILRRPVVDLAQDVDAALGRLAHAQGQQAAAEEVLRLAQQDVREAQQAVADARDALFREHPELAPTSAPVVSAAPVAPETGYEVVEVDDENDPRFTAGVDISPNEDDPLPPVEWEEHDG